MSSVLVLIIIPDKKCEEEIREKEKNNEKLKKKLQKELSVDIDKIEGENGEPATLEKICQDGLTYLGIPDATWTKSSNDKYWHITFPVDLEDSDIVIQYFKSHGIGVRFSTSIGIIPFSLFCYNEESAAIENEAGGSVEPEMKEINNLKEKQGKFLKSVTARLTVAQIVSSVRTSATLTFDFICYLIFASWIAAMGLLDDSVISLVASMLVSPMMGPVMAITFGTIIKDRSLRNMGAKNILFCILVTISFGFLFGMIALNFIDKWDASPDKQWPSKMMSERGLVRVTWVGTLVAFPSGCAVAISLLSGNDASLVGVAISVSLLPPAVNAGLLWAFSLNKFIYSMYSPGNELVSYFSLLQNKTIKLERALTPMSNYTPVYNDNVALETLFLGLLSLALSVINILNIIIGALLFLKIKEIAPLKTLSPESRRFFQEDIRIAREYNERDPSGNLGENVLREWASIVGLDSNDVMKPEAREVQLQTLLDIAKDVEADQVFQTVTKSINNTDNLARRLSQGIFINKSNSNLSQINDLNNPRLYNRRATSAAIFSNPAPNILISPTTESPQHRGPPQQLYAGHNRRRISTVALNRYHEKDNENNLSPKKTTTSNNGMSNGITNYAFSFNESDIENQNNNYDDDKKEQQPQQQQIPNSNRRNSSAALRVQLQNSEHAPYSLWPTTRFTVVPYNQSPPKSQ